MGLAALVASAWIVSKELVHRLQSRETLGALIAAQSILSTSCLLGGSEWSAVIVDIIVLERLEGSVLCSMIVLSWVSQVAGTWQSTLYFAWPARD